MGLKESITNKKLRKIVLLEMSLGFSVPSSEWVKYAPGIWKFKFHNIDNTGTTVSYNAGTGAAGYFSAGASGSGLVPNRRYKTKVNSFLSNGLRYTFYSAYGDIVSVEKACYWDGTNQILYVHFDNEETPYEQSANIIGVLTGYCKNDNTGYFDGIYYEGRLLSVPNLARRRSPLFYGTTSIGDLSFTLDNSDGFFNDYRKNDIHGMKIQLKVGLEGLDYDEFITKYTGYLDDYSRDDDSIRIKSVDDRELFTRKIGTNFLSVDNYPNMDDKHEGKAIPLTWGPVDRKEAVCLNENEVAPSVYNFIFVDTEYHSISSIDQVYVDGVAVSHSNESLANGTFDLSTSNFEPGQEVTISYTGFINSSNNIIEHPLDVIVDALAFYQDVVFNYGFYNTDEWGIVKSSITEKVSYTTGFKQEQINDIIESMGNVAYGSFEVQGDGKYNFRKSNRQSQATSNIHFYQIIGQVKEMGEGKRLFLSSAKVGYSPVSPDNSYKYVYDRSKEGEIFSKHRKYKEKTFETNIQTKANAESRALTLVNDFGGSFQSFNFTVPYELYNLNWNDIAVCELIKEDVPNQTYGLIKGEITEILEDLNNFTIDLNVRSIEDATEFATRFIKETLDSSVILWTEKVDTGRQYTEVV